MDVMCYDRTRGLMKESEHPFTSGFGTTDVRVTNHYYEDLLLSSIFSAVHLFLPELIIFYNKNFKIHFYHLPFLIPLNQL